MTSQEKRQKSVSLNSKEELESPFLDEELLIEDNNSEGVTRYETLYREKSSNTTIKETPRIVYGTDGNKINEHFIEELFELIPETTDEESVSFDELEVEELEAQEALDLLEFEIMYEEPPVTEVLFPSGESLLVVSGPIEKGEEHYDAFSARIGLKSLPLLDTSGANRSKRLSNNFLVDELARSGRMKFNKARIDPKLVTLLQSIRDYVGRSVIITSGYRSWAHNVKIYKKKGVKPKLSPHTAGIAADIKISGMTGFEIAKTAIDVGWFDIGIGIGRSYAHIDTRGKWARWTYVGAPQNALKKIDDYREVKYKERKDV